MRRLALFVSLVLAGCADDSGDDKPPREADEAAIAGDAFTTQRATARLGGLARPFFFAVGGAAPPDDAVGGALAMFAPAGCAASAKVAPGTVRVTLNGCSGAGVRDLSGVVLARYLQDEAAGWTLQLSVPPDETLTAGGRPLVVSASARVRPIGDGAFSVVVSSSVDTVTPDGHHVVAAHEHELTTLGEGCSSTSGSGTAHVDGRGRTTLVDGVVTCPGSCPSEGTFRATSLDTKRSVTLRFDGSTVAHATGKNGRTFDVPLACE